MHDLPKLKKERSDALKSFKKLGLQGGHAPHCLTLTSDLNFDPSCNVCNSSKTYVQLCADVAAGEAAAKCRTLAGEPATE